ncbi:MAG: alpha/beta hydrolase [Aureispira sp.]|nr:alpha/beta hydrolase [Aureispira sp.]
MEIQKVKIGDLTFECRVQGNPDDEPLIMLHGWPETSYLWIDYMDKFSKEGYYCIAPNLRGFSLSACPKGKKHYDVEIIAKDIIDIADHYGFKKFHLLAHDWGGLTGWVIAQQYEDRIASWSALAVPTLNAFAYAYKNDKKQYKMSSYMRQFQLRGLSEMVLRGKKFKLLRDVWGEHNDQKQVDHYVETFSHKKVLTASLNYYRANFKYLKGGKALEKFDKKVMVPTLYIWGKNDDALGRTGAEKTKEYVGGEFQFLELEAGHWLVQEKKEEVYKAVLAHLKKY